MTPGRVFTAALLALAVTVSCGSERSDAPATGGVPGASGGVGNGGLAGTGASPATGGLPIGAGGASTGGAPCRGTGESCNNSLDCCEGSTCNNTAQAPSLNGCHPRCTQNSECSTGCCLLYTGDTNGICAEAQWCGCGTSGSRCGSDSPACCADHVCLATDAMRTSYACSKKCQSNADCTAPGCCVEIPSLSQKACLPPSYCPLP